MTCDLPVLPKSPRYMHKGHESADVTVHTTSMNVRVCAAFKENAVIMLVISCDGETLPESHLFSREMLLCSAPSLTTFTVYCERSITSNEGPVVVG